MTPIWPSALFFWALQHSSRRRSGRRLRLAAVALLVAACGAPSAVTPTPLPQQKTIKDIGSDTIVNLALAWAQAYGAERPEVNISVTGGGSGTGLAALLNGTADLANASRAITPEEIAAAKANGITPVQHVIARDAIAVLVNPANPVGQLTLPQLSAHVHRPAHQLAPGGRPGPAGGAAFARNQFRHARLFSGQRHPAGPSRQPGAVLARHAAAAQLGGHLGRGAPEPQRHRL